MKRLNTSWASQDLVKFWPKYLLAASTELTISMTTKTRQLPIYVIESKNINLFLIKVHSQKEI